jgi:hypothetical protein
MVIGRSEPFRRTAAMTLLSTVEGVVEPAWHTFPEIERIIGFPTST